MDAATRDKIEAAAFRKLMSHLQARTDVQNIDMMGHTGFCRNCLSDWLGEAARDAGIEMDKAAARAYVYGMPADAYKAKYQSPASAEQLARMAESQAKTDAMRDW